jgi:hypothetical protein
MLMDGGQMCFGAIALVLVEAIDWIFLVKLHHQTVTCHFGDD